MDSDLILGLNTIVMLLLGVVVLYRQGVAPADRIVTDAIQKRLDDDALMRRDAERLDRFIDKQAPIMGLLADGLIKLGMELAKSTPMQSDDTTFEWLNELKERSKGAVIEDEIPADGEEVVKG